MNFKNNTAIGSTFQRPVLLPAMKAKIEEHAQLVEDMARAISIEEQYQNDAPTSSDKVEYPQKLVYAI